MISMLLPSIILYRLFPVMLSLSIYTEKIRDFRGWKAQYIQDDCRQVDRYTAMMCHMGIHILFTPYALEKKPLVYDEKRLPGVVKLTSLVGYVPERHKTVVSQPLRERAIDVGYRVR